MLCYGFKQIHFITVILKEFKSLRQKKKKSRYVAEKICTCR